MKQIDEVKWIATNRFFSLIRIGYFPNYSLQTKFTSFRLQWVIWSGKRIKKTLSASTIGEIQVYIDFMSEVGSTNTDEPQKKMTQMRWWTVTNEKLYGSSKSVQGKFSNRVEIFCSCRMQCAWNYLLKQRYGSDTIYRIEMLKTMKPLIRIQAIRWIRWLVYYRENKKRYMSISIPFFLAGLRNYIKCIINIGAIKW